MKKININKMFIISIICAMILLVFSSNIIATSMVEFDDEMADEQANEELKQQEKEDQENAGKSSNNFLSELSVEGYKISPTFDKQTINYSIDGEITAKKINIQAKTDDDRATVTGTGEVELQTGENNFRISVKAENGTERAYFIKVIKKIDNEELKLSSLKIKAVDKDGEKQDVDLNIDFSSDIFAYSCEVSYTITKIEVEAVANKTNSKITIEDNPEELKEGPNTIRIKVTDDDGNETIYKVQVNKQYSLMANGTIDKESDNKNIVIGIIAVVLLVMVILLFTKKSRKRKH